ncbi:hypothetical protein [Spartinivicinus ruber]|uniref:hypothetical protein n=1 Tax=Spartinivicinus ruber TaxID=2683272 RepID=UPI0013D8460D|nr:hypothetical protein [Spartinivicinus ruber]
MTRNDEEYIKMSAMTLLTPKSVKYEGVPGGMPTLTPEDVAAALGMGDLPREAYLLGLLKYTDDKTVLHELDNLVQEFVIKKGIEEGWREPWPNEKKRSLMFFKQFARSMINEVVDDNLCKRCNGSGIDCRTSHHRKCNCNNGRRAPLKKELAKYCGINEKCWRERWHTRYTESLKQIHTWRAQLIWHLHTFIEKK